MTNFTHQGAGPQERAECDCMTPSVCSVYGCEAKREDSIPALDDCPFCGEPTIEIYSRGSTLSNAFYACCENCGAQGPTHFNRAESYEGNQRQAGEAWNDRMPTSENRDQYVPHPRFRPTRADGSPDVGPPIIVCYKNWQGKTDDRTISPVMVWYGSTKWHPREGWILHCYDWRHRDWRDYSLAECDFRSLFP